MKLHSCWISLSKSTGPAVARRQIAEVRFSDQKIQINFVVWLLMVSATIENLLILLVLYARSLGNKRHRSWDPLRQKKINIILFQKYRMIDIFGFVHWWRAEFRASSRCNPKGIHHSKGREFDSQLEIKKIF